MLYDSDKIVFLDMEPPHQPRFPNDRDKAQVEFYRYLWKECQLINPEVVHDVDGILGHHEVVVATGRSACNYFFGTMADPDMLHGRPILVDSRVIVPVHSAAYGFSSTEAQAAVAWDYQQLKLFLDGEIEPVTLEDAHPNPVYHVHTGQGRLVLTDPAIDTEGTPAAPWCLTTSVEAGIALLHRPDPARLRTRLTFAGRPILHNSLWDLGVLRSMGIALPDYSYDDTMVMAYELGIEPQGLKALAYRHCAMVMQEYTELTDPYRLKKQILYLKQVLAWLDNQSLKERQQPLGHVPSRAKKASRTRKTAGKRSSTTASRKK